MQTQQISTALRSSCSLVAHRRYMFAVQSVLESFATAYCRGHARTTTLKPVGAHACVAQFALRSSIDVVTTSWMPCRTANALPTITGTEHAGTFRMRFLSSMRTTRSNGRRACTGESSLLHEMSLLHSRPSASRRISDGVCCCQVGQLHQAEVAAAIIRIWPRWRTSVAVPVGVQAHARPAVQLVAISGL